MKTYDILQEVRKINEKIGNTKPHIKLDILGSLIMGIDVIALDRELGAYLGVNPMEHQCKQMCIKERYNAY